MNLKVLSWNCQSAQGKIIELRRLLETQCFHLILLQETWLNPKVQIKIPNFTCLRNDRPSITQYPHGGVLIFVHESINYKVVEFAKLDFIEAIFIRIAVDAFSFTIGSIYNSSSLSITQSRGDLTKLLSRSGPTILAGDFNSKHTSWNNARNCRKGQDLYKLCNHNLHQVHFPDDITLIPAKGDPSIVDLVITKGVYLISKPEVINDLSSDHLPVKFEIPIYINIPEAIKIKSYKNVNWKKVKDSIENDLTTDQVETLLESEEQIDSQISRLKNAIDKASTAHVPLKKPFSFRYPFSQEIKDLVSKRNMYRKVSERLPKLRKVVNNLNRLIKNRTAALNAQSWNSKLASLKTENLSLFQFTKTIKTKKIAFPPLENPDKKMVYSDQEKANLIAQAFLTAHTISDDPTSQTQKIANSISQFSAMSIVVPAAGRIRFSEVQTEIKRLKVKKACGYDEISNRLVKALPDAAIKLLTSIFNACFNIGYFPSDWKIGKVIALPKPGKNHQLPNSYRPITLLPVIGKMFERIVLDRMQDFEHENKILINQQFGFRARHSTTQQIMRMVELICYRFNINKSTAISLIDIEKAFDSVWHEALMHKLMSFNFPPYLLKIVFSFLRDRVSYVSINNKESDRYGIPAGVPQGSPLSPHLFNLFINDIPIPKHCKIAVFADDTALVSSITNYNLPTLVDRMSSGLAELQNHFKSWKVKLNERKTEAILFSKSTIMKQIKDDHQILFDGKLLKWQDTAKYLGVIFDSKMTLKANVENNIKKAKKGISILFCLLRKNSHLEQKSKITLYRSYIRPILTYACPSFAHIAKTHIRKLQIQQNKCLRMVLNAHYRTRTDKLHKKTNIPTIEDYLGKLTTNFYKNCSYSENKLIKNLGLNHSNSTVRIKHKFPQKA